MKKLFFQLLAFLLLSPLFAAKHWFADAFSEKLITRTGAQVDSAAALNGKIVAVYFCDSRNTRCRNFTPRLVKFYTQYALKNNIEIVCFSFDNNSLEMQNYMRKSAMPWPAVPFDKKKIAEIREDVNIYGGPSLLILDKNGNIITRSGIADVEKLGKNAIEKWNAGPNPAAEQEVFSGNTSTWAKGPSADWHTTMDTALTAAKKENKHIYLYMTRYPSFPKRLDTEEFKKFATKKLVLVWHDLGRKDAKMNSQQVYNAFIRDTLKTGIIYPTGHILDSQGRYVRYVQTHPSENTYIQGIEQLLTRPSRWPTPPEWIKQSPQELESRIREWQQQQRENREKAIACIEAAKDKLKFEITAWGLTASDVNTPFSPTAPINVPAGQSLYFKIKYQLPPDIRLYMGLRTYLYMGNSKILKNREGEEVFELYVRSGSGPCRAKRLQLSGSSRMPGTFFTAATFPCNITWEKNN